MKTEIPILLALLCLTGCVRQSLEPKVTLHNDNVLLPTIAFSTSEESDAYIEYWPKEHTHRTQRSRHSTGKDHRIVLLNLKPSVVYDYVIHTTNPDRTTNVLNFQTGPLPPEVTQTKKQVIDTTQFDGYILVRRLSPTGVDVMVDKEGDVVWYHLYDSVVRRPFTWTANHTVLSVYDTSRIVEYDMYGDKILDMELEDHGIPNMLHHDAVLNAKGDIVALTHDSVRMDLRKFGYAKDEYIRGEGIMVFTRDGKKLWDWNILSVYDPRDYPKRKVDLTHSLGHSNSLAIDSDGHYLVSFRDFSEIWKINSSDGSVIWKLGEDGNIQLDTAGYFMRQHAAYLNEVGEIMLFDNGDRKIRSYSRVLSFKIDEAAKQAEVKSNVILSKELSADKMCSAVLVSPGKYLVCTSKKSGIISVVNDNAEVVWRVDLNSPSYRAYYLSDPFSFANASQH
ncbi:MAG TPA: aryl-sulfate sulfotransferase [Chryseolinea sp.]|nr:aryl-sulfate sulfotransferase [Chryseolinea sp.]